MFVWDEVGTARAAFFDYFQGCNLQGVKSSFKRKDEIYKEKQTAWPAQHLTHFSLNFLSRLVNSAMNFYYHLIHFIYIKDRYNV